MGSRKVSKIVGGAVQYDGAGVKLVRVIGKADVHDFDPFLMLDAFDSQDPADYVKGFPWHPHRGIETVTYLIHGDIEHGDSLGNQGSILDGCCQWMTAGRGIIHQEMPQAVDRILGAQLWINLPRKDKMTEPAYRDITDDMIPEVTDGKSTVRIISGRYREKVGPVQGDYVKTLYLDVRIEPEGTWHMSVDPEATLFCYLVSGSGRFDASDSVIPSHRAVLLVDGDEVTIVAGMEGLRFLFISGRPLREPIAWGGPIVMNTREELHQAFKDLDEGNFIR
ncbi:MAG: pirin family protein [Sphaerochaetaceae bacterium]|jgi:redox-sensitive bicupin YhaK (pirin superfamily)|nr:pirin family protein [Sphaerochaetaceae bacterium]MDD3941289.1 pirin family protein [Sphaerochaetaceae bacterium]MDX9939912.1 pirin family protein [Sphaerochaetaceae bacterium]